MLELDAVLVELHPPAAIRQVDVDPPTAILLLFEAEVDFRSPRAVPAEDEPDQVQEVRPQVGVRSLVDHREDVLQDARGIPGFLPAIVSHEVGGQDGARVSLFHDLRDGVVVHVCGVSSRKGPSAHFGLLKALRPRDLWPVCTIKKEKSQPGSDM